MAVIEYDEYKQKLQALEPTLQDLEKALGIPKAREELAALQRLAASADKPVYVAGEDDGIRVDARSFLGLCALDYARNVRVITDSLYVIRRLEIDLRNRELAEQAAR